MNNGHLITLQIRMESRYRVCGATHEAQTFIRSPEQFLNQNRTGEDMGHFSAGPINKAVPSFTSSLTRVRDVNGDGRHSKHLSLLKKCSQLRHLRCLELLRQVLITSQLLLSCRD